MDIEDKMKKDIGRCVVFRGEKVMIINAFSCYEGDFYEIKYQSEEHRRINIWSDEGMEFIKTIT